VVFHLLVWAGAQPDGELRWLPVALTYALHALLWAGAAALIGRKPTLPASIRNLCWKVALIGPLLTALAGAVLVSAHASTPHLEQPSTGATSVRPQLKLTGSTATLFGVQARFSNFRKATHYLALGVIGATSLGVLRFGVLLLLARRRLRDRRPVRDPRVLQRFRLVCSLSNRRPVVLSEDANIVGPLVIGLNEVCVPLRTVNGLSDAELDSVLAHELAHVERGDGLWFPAVGLLEAALWLHPITHWVASRFRESAELACDDRAVALTGDPRGLAQALVQVASRAPWARPHSAAPGMFHSTSALVPRVARLMTCQPRSEPSTALSVRARPVLLGVLGVALASWNVTVVHARPEPGTAAVSAIRAQSDLAPSALEDLPDPATRSRLIVEHLSRAREIEAELAALRALPEAAVEGSPAAARVLDLSQDLYHAQTTAAWLEQSLVDSEQGSGSR
jgi:beta-lactamase regulating signal transducer with metallopeptidase domain